MSYNYFNSPLAIKIDVFVNAGKIGRVHYDMITKRAAYQFKPHDRNPCFIRGWIENRNGQAWFRADPTDSNYHLWMRFRRSNESQDSMRNIEAMWTVFAAKLEAVKNAHR